MGLLDQWNKNKFSIYKNEEKTVLKLLESISKWLEEIIIGIDGKTDLYGDHKGTWQGLNKPTLSEEGMRATVEQLIDETIPDINSQMEQINKTIPDINSQMEQINELSIKQRYFKPKLGIFLDLNPNGGNMIDDETIIEMITLVKEHNIEGIVVQPWIIWDNETKKLRIKNDIEKIKFLLGKINEFGLEISSLKFHMYNINLNNIISSGDIENFKLQYKKLIYNYVYELKDFRIKNIICFNENNILYNKDSSHTEFVLDVLNDVKSIGFKVSISTMNSNEFLKVDKRIQENVDLICLNTYPKLSFKKDKTVLHDCVDSWNNSNDIRNYRLIKSLYPNKNIIMSETGCNDYWSCLYNPGNWSLKDDIKTNGEAPNMMLESLFLSEFKDIIEEVWWCYYPTILNNTCKSTILRYIGGLK